MLIRHFNKLVSGLLNFYYHLISVIQNEFQVKNIDLLEKVLRICGRSLPDLRLALFLLFFIGLLNTSFAQTELPASISQNFTALKAYSPYIANHDVQVQVGAKLTVEPGVTIYFQRNSGLYVAGNIDLTGTENDPIILQAAPGETKWEVLSINKASEMVKIFWVEIYGATDGDNSDRDRAAISVRKSDVIIDHCKIYNADTPIFFNACHGIILTNSILHARTSCDYVNFLSSDGLIENNEFIGANKSNTDAIDFDASQGIIRGNYIHDFMGYNTDAIDIGGRLSDVVIEYNIIENIFDKAVSIGEEATAEVNYNLIINCNGGIASKDLSVVNASNNTMYQNEISYQAFSREGVNKGGGVLHIKNSIIINSDTPISSRDNSTVNVNYTLCNTLALSGTGNIQTDPQFINPSQGNFNLRENSPAIDSGDPASELDADGTRADMGAFPTTQSSAFGLIISEIHYRPVVIGENENDYEFLELYNNGGNKINLSGFKFTSGISFAFRVGEEISPGEYIVLAKDETKYNHLDIKLYEWWEGDLNDLGEEIILKDDDDQIVFEFNYGNQYPWPQLGITNQSIELDPLDNDFFEATFWRLSIKSGGSPGNPNDMGPISGLIINEILAKSTLMYPDDHGDPSDWIEVYNTTSTPIDLGGLFVSDVSDDPGLFQISESSSQLTTVLPDSYLVLYASNNTDKGITHLPFTLSSGGEQIGIYQYYNNEFVTLDYISFPATQEGQSYGRIPDGSGDFRILEIPSPGSRNEEGSVEKYFDLRINEFVARYDNSYPDEHGYNSDWIEIYNGGQESVNLAGLFFSDLSADLEKSRIPLNILDSASIDPGEFIVFRADAKPELGFNHLDFELSGNGEEVVLSVSIAGKIEVIDQLSYPPQVVGKSYGRLGDGGEEWVYFGWPTPESSNSTTIVQSINDSKQLDLRVYPNPTSNSLMILLPTTPYSSFGLLEAFDIHGKKIKVWDLSELGSIISWNIKSEFDDLPSGIYFLRLSGLGPSISKRFILE